MLSPEENLDNLEQQIGEAGRAARRVDREREARRRKRSGQVVVVLSLMIGIIALLVSKENAEDISETKVNQKLNMASIEALQSANEELSRKGLPLLPVPEPNEELDINALARATAALVLSEIQNDPKYRGQTGLPGLDGMPCLPSLPGCQGEPGIPGQSGQPGVDGPPGERGLPGPPGEPCLPSIPECRGPAGADGKDGAMGVPGMPGQGFSPENPIYFEGNNLECEMVVNMVNPVQQHRIPVNGVLCVPANPPPS